MNHILILEETVPNYFKVVKEHYHLSSEKTSVPGCEGKSPLPQGQKRFIIVLSTEDTGTEADPSSPCLYDEQNNLYVVLKLSPPGDTEDFEHTRTLAHRLACSISPHEVQPKKVEIAVSSSQGTREDDPLSLIQNEKARRLLFWLTGFLQAYGFRVEKIRPAHLPNAGEGS